MSPKIKRPGRKPSPHGQNRVYVRCWEDEQTAWAAAAEAEGRDLASWTRHTLNQAAKRAARKAS